MSEHRQASQPEKRRRAEVSPSRPLPPSKTTNKHGTTNTPTKTALVMEPTQPPPSTLTTPSTTIPATQASKSTSTPSEIQMVSNVKAGDSSTLRQPQVLSTPLPRNGKSSLPSGGDTQAISDSLSSAHHIPTFDDKQVMLSPMRHEKDSAEGTIEDSHIKDILRTDVDVAGNIHKRKAVNEDSPRKKSVKIDAMVRLNCGTSDEATKVFVTIAKNGLETRFEVTQEGSES